MDPAQTLPDLENFLLHLRANGYSPRTVYNYRRDLLLFARFLAQSGLPFHRVDKLTLTRFKAALADPDHVRLLEDRPQKDRLKARSVNRTLSALRSYLRFLVEIDRPVPIPPDAVNLAVGPELVAVEAAELRDAQAGGKEDLEDGPVS